MTEEHAEGICAVGAAFVDPIGRDSALPIPAPVAQFAKKRDQMSERILAARNDIVRLFPDSRAPLAE